MTKDNIIAVLLTVFGTVTSGVIVFIVGQILTTVWLHPLQKYKELKQKTSEMLIYYADIYRHVADFANMKEDKKETYAIASNDLRKLSCEWAGFIETLSWIKVGIPKRKDLKTAANELMRLSNSLFSAYNSAPSEKQNDNNKEIANRIRKALKLYQYEENTD